MFFVLLFLTVYNFLKIWLVRGPETAPAVRTNQNFGIGPDLTLRGLSKTTLKPTGWRDITDGTIIIDHKELMGNPNILNST